MDDELVIEYELVASHVKLLDKNPYNVLCSQKIEFVIKQLKAHSQFQ